MIYLLNLAEEIEPVLLDGEDGQPHLVDGVNDELLPLVLQGDQQSDVAGLRLRGQELLQLSDRGLILADAQHALQYKVLN